MKSELDDNECLLLLRKGDPHALKYIIRVYFPVLCAYSYKITEDRVQSEDITEETLVKIWERQNSFNSFNELKSFMYTTVRNMSLNALRSKFREQNRIKELALISEKTLDTNEFLHEEMLAEIRKAVQTLSPQLRQIFILSHYKKLNTKQIADALNISEQTVRNQKSKMMGKLKLMLSNKSFNFILLSI